MTQNIIIISSLIFLYFSIGWLYSFNVKVFAWIDFIWSSSFLIVIASLAFFNWPLNKPQMILMGMYTLWSLRLSSHLASRIRREGEDKRYLNLIRHWKVWYGLKFYLLYLVEALLVLVLSLPLFLSIGNDLTKFQYLAMIVFSLSISLEALSDYQLKNFIKNRLNKRKVCNVGLWKYSRHPNYFFETIIWLSYGLFVFEAKYGFIGLLPYILMLILITQVTGIPPAEESSMKSKPNAYEIYKKQTSKFIPWFSKALIITALLFQISGDYTMAQDASQEQLQRIEKVFNELRADNLNILNNFYDDNVTFKDPLGTHEGLDSVKNYYKNLYKNVEEIRFDFSSGISQKNRHVVVWTMHLRAPALNSGEEVIVHGNSVIEFGENNKVSYHRDYFDMGEFIYEDVPVLGTLIRYIKNKLRAH
ncbi:hypothetical protein BIY24_03930 [Halobacteriovorax marinus]|uniref:DUF1295 domain-containing protein n=1 Tax=Halobacteriovorax marinus TaxID=97084 RepID=UPI000BC350DC|nr:DUF1295 domain-containing protein [Halobacteriovorax marinus]ATH07116.1 hypothetical protein BIY24_03930 [Halobacteriovorax marinus]